MKNKIELFTIIILIFLGISLYSEIFVLSYMFLGLLVLLSIVKLPINEKISLHVKKEKDSNVYLDAFEKSGIYAKLDINNNITYANRQFYQIMQTTQLKLKNVKFNKLIKSNSNEIFETIKYQQSWEGTKVFITDNKDEIHLSCYFIPIFDKNESLFEVLFLATDVTELITSKTNIKNSLYQDNITKLPNRLKLFTHKSLKKSTEATYIIFNIDSFDTINNLYGNLFGDTILYQVARWLENNLITQKTKLYKLEADIYVMVAFEQIKEKLLVEYLQKISNNIQIEKFLCKDTEIDISMTIGASQGKINQLKLSQIAYKDAKISKKSFAIYDKTSMKEEEYTKNIQTSKIIKNALENNLVVPYFQPIMNIESGEIQKFEFEMRNISKADALSYYSKEKYQPICYDNTKCISEDTSSVLQYS